MRKSSLLIALSCLPLTAALAAGAPGTSTGMGTRTASGGTADPDHEVTTALQHAGMSAGSAKIEDVHAHLHHVINCLVGPSGAGFDPTAEDPCKGQGSGAMNDISGRDKESKELGEAIKDANKGLKENDLKKAQKYAKNVMKDLQDAQKYAQKSK